MKHAKLGDLDVSRIGLGAMGMSFAYTGAGSDDAESIRTIHRALDLGVTLIDTAEVYGPYINEELVGRALKGRRDQVVLATKFGMISHTGAAHGPGQQPRQHPHRGRGLAAAARHRPHRPVLPAPGRPRTRRSRTPSARSPSWSTEGKVRHIGLSEAGADHDPPRARRAPDHRAAVGVLAVDPRPRGRASCRVLRELGIGFVAVLTAGPRLPHRHDPLHRRARRRRLPQDQPAVHRRELRAQPAHRRRGRGDRRRSRTPRRRRSPSPGCSPRATTSPRSPAPSASPASRRTSPPTASNSPPTSSPRSTP